MKDKIQKIADYYGIEHQLEKTVEELTELIQAINDYLIKFKMNDEDNNTDHIAEEIADVTIMTRQLLYLLECEEEFECYEELKVIRQLNRIREEKAAE